MFAAVNTCLPSGAGQGYGIVMRFLALLSLLVGLSVTAAVPEPPELPQEFRGMWVASVGNIDWPTKPGLPVATQQAQLRGMLDMAKRLNLNVVILQVRPSCDALYASPYEPWSEYLSGRMGQAPFPKWDPLQFACEEAHVRGLELHAWANPFRARYHQAVSPISADHVTRRHPEWVIPYGRFFWLDPGNSDARDWSLKVLTDIVRRYDIDGLHLDDYFYPYPETLDGVGLPFVDDVTYDRYRRNGGRLTREDWRRDNINGFVQRLHSAIHAEKPWVKFGLSPFGIWRPGFPAGIKGLDAYTILSADSRQWLNAGWCDYMAPQLYWPTSRREQSFQGLLHWWAEQNTSGRLLVPGIASASVGKDRQSGDVINQVQLSRKDGGAKGVVFWNASSLRDNLGGVANLLAGSVFDQPALVPETPWLRSAEPPTPELTGILKPSQGFLSLKWKLGTNDPVSVLVLQTRYGTQWQQGILPAQAGYREFDRRRGLAIPDEVRLVPIGRTGAHGTAAVWPAPASTP